MMDFDATSIYPSAMWEEKPVYPKKGSGFAFKPHLKDAYVEAFTNQSINQDGNESALIGIHFYYPPEFISQHLAVRVKVGRRKLNRMRNGYIIDTLTSVDIQKNGGKVIEFYQSVICQENFKISLLDEI